MAEILTSQFKRCGCWFEAIERVATLSESADGKVATSSYFGGGGGNDCNFLFYLTTKMFLALSKPFWKFLRGNCPVAGLGYRWDRVAIAEATRLRAWAIAEPWPSLRWTVNIPNMLSTMWSRKLKVGKMFIATNVKTCHVCLCVVSSREDWTWENQKQGEAKSLNDVGSKPSKMFFIETQDVSQTLRGVKW